MNVVLARSPRSKPQNQMTDDVYTDDYRVMVLEPGKAMRYLDDNRYLRSEAVRVFAAFNQANQRGRQHAVIVRIGVPVRKVEVAVDGEHAAERTIEYRPLLIVIPTTRELRAAQSRPRHAGVWQRA